MGGMSFTSPEFILGVLGVLGIGGFVTVMLTLRPTRKKITEEANKQGADSAAVVTSTAISLLEPMKKEIKELRSALDDAHTKLKLAMEELDLARSEIRQLRDDAASMTRELEVYRRAARDSHYGTNPTTNESTHD